MGIYARIPQVKCCHQVQNGETKIFPLGIKVIFAIIRQHNYAQPINYHYKFPKN